MICERQNSESRSVLHCGDSVKVLASYPDHSFDSIVTDPPYGLGEEPDALAMLRDWMESGHHEVGGKKGFMGKEWDSFVPQPALWKECLRVLKPGGHLLSFGGTRTVDLVALALRIAGFEIRDQIAWVYGSGFPKSRSSLKPSMEPIVLARKPVIGTAKKNRERFGTGGLNIEGCRIPSCEDVPNRSREGERTKLSTYGDRGATDFSLKPGPRGGDSRGRWPGNFVHDGSEEVLSLFPHRKAGGNLEKNYGRRNEIYGKMPPRDLWTSYGDEGSAARFFYCAKASRTDRNEGVEGETKELLWSSGTKNPGSFQPPDTCRSVANHHPTVKPTSLMRWLCRLVTPPGGVILDPFMGSGSTGKAAILEGFRFVGIDRDEDYVRIAGQRINHAKKGKA